MAGRLDICEHARAWASAAADGELSELEAASLEAHLAGCPRCAAFARELDWLVRELRTAALVEPALPAERPVVRPRRRRAPLRTLQLAGAAAAVAAAVGLGHVAATLTAPTHATASAASTAAAPQEAPFEQALLAMVARQLPHGRTIPA